jgi:hypothetical protein
VKVETQQTILKALRKAWADMSAWVRKLGWSEEQILQLFIAIMRENGMASQFVLSSATSHFPKSGDQSPAQAEKALTEFLDGRYAARLLAEPEPTPKQLDATILAIGDGLANLRLHYFAAAKLGPRHRRGGRPRELADPAKRQEIREEIKGRRDAGVKLQKIYQLLAKRYGVSSSTIKRIWLEPKRENSEVPEDKSAPVP